MLIEILFEGTAGVKDVIYSKSQAIYLDGASHSFVPLKKNPVN